MKDSPLLSIVVPIYNEEEVFHSFIAELSTTLEEIHGYRFEILLIDDGSSDGTLRLVEEAIAANPDIRALVFSRNFGHQMAVSAGYDYARGDAIVVMDGDLQDPPALIPQLLKHYENGYDVVYVERTTREGFIVLRLFYKLFYRLLRSVAEIEIPLDSGDFGLVSRRVRDLVVNAPEYHRFHRGLRAWVGFRQISVPCNRPDRSAGASKYNFRKLLKLALDGLFSFSLLPLRFASFFGGLTILGAVMFSLFAFYVKLFGDGSPTGFTATIALLTMLSGVQLMCLGIIGEYVGRTYEQVKNRPRYVIDRVLGREHNGA